MTLAILLLAAGQGTRMNSKQQKILHQVGGKPMLLHLFEAAEQLADLPPLLVVGPGAAQVRQLIGDRALYAEQAQQLGTGHATMMAEPLLNGKADQVIVTYGDMPLLRRQTLHRLAAMQRETAAAITLLTVMGSPASSFGRIVRHADGSVREIVEVAQAKNRPDSQALLDIREQNVGVYCFAADFLWANIGQLPLRQARSGPEYYLTDLIETAVSQQLPVHAVTIDDADEGLGAGTRAELVAVEKAFRRRANAHWLANGVTLVDPDSTYIDPDVHIGQDTIIWPNSYLQGQTVIGPDCVIGPNSVLRDAQVGAGCRVEMAMVVGAQLADGTAVAPFSLLEG